MERKAVILDTDIGTNVDDTLALALILNSPELELCAITTVHGDTALRARIVLKLLGLRGATGMPVAAGATQPLLGKRPVYWAGHEGQGLLEPGDDALQPDPQGAVKLIVNTVMGRPGEITLIALGPLTNVALALRAEPQLADKLAGIVLMGGAVGGPYRQRVPLVDHPYSALALPWIEHNFACDPDAAHVVLASGTPLTIVPLDVTCQVQIRPADIARVRAAGDAYHQVVADQVERYLSHAGRECTNLTDPLAVTSLLDPSLMHLELLHAVVETVGEHSAGKLLVHLPCKEMPATARVALDVDAARAERFIIDRLAK